MFATREASGIVVTRSSVCGLTAYSTEITVSGKQQPQPAETPDYRTVPVEIPALTVSVRWMKGGDPDPGRRSLFERPHGTC
jgi:hypothetical protein